MYFPQSSTRRSQAFQTNKKAFLFYPFSRERMSYLINTHVSQEVGRLSDSPLCWLSETESGSKVRAKCGHMFFCCLRQSCWLDLHPPVLLINTVHLLTQVCTVWSFINSVSADGIGGGLRHLDPHRIMTAFSICLTPPASKPEIYWDTYLVKAFNPPRDDISLQKIH